MSFIPKATDPRTQLVPICEDARRMWAAWVGGTRRRGDLLKDQQAPYWPGVRSPAWQKCKQRVTLEVFVTEATNELVPWGDWGQAAVMTFAYWHPKREALVTVCQSVRVPNSGDWEVRSRCAAELLCRGVMARRCCGTLNDASITRGVPLLAGSLRRGA